MKDILLRILCAIFLVYFAIAAYGAARHGEWFHALEGCIMMGLCYFFPRLVK